MDTNFTLHHLSHPPRQAMEGPAPALLLLHGFGSNEQDLMALAPYLDPRLHILSARAPLTMGHGMFAWYMVDIQPGGSFRYDPAQARHSVELVEQWVEECVTAYNLDRARLFLGGFSQGAIQSSAVLLRSPEQVAGIVAMSGRWPEPVEAERAPDTQLEGKPVLVIHGVSDPTIPIRYGREARDRWAALPVDLTYQEFPMGHNVSMESLALVQGWLKARLDEGSQE